MLGAIMKLFNKEKSQEEVVVTAALYTPKDEYLRKVRDSSVMYIDWLKTHAKDENENSARVKELSSSLATFMTLVKEWENRTSPAVTRKYLSRTLALSNSSDEQRLSSLDAFRLQYFVVTDFQSIVDRLLYMLKRGNFQNKPTKVVIAALWSGQEGLPYDTTITADKQLSEEGSVSLTAFGMIVEAVKRKNITAVQIETDVILDEIEYGKEVAVKYPNFNKKTRIEEAVTKTHFESIKARPSIRLRVKFLENEMITFDLDSGSRMALTSFAGKLNNLATCYDRLTLIAQENVRTLNPTWKHGKNVWDDLAKVILTDESEIDGSDPKISALADVDGLSTNEIVTETSSVGDDASVTDTTISDVQPDTQTQESESENLTTDGVDVEVTTPTENDQTSNEEN